ncbi:hypothetical protein Pla86_30640 [Planctomycetes bacterium Pla86]|uniref:Uncharacterized protein n=1 Tax=Engelhardtia mirabilis TaxID=2528011 RepID=A0A518BLX5_9BACT|nr:hypothetical protein Pla133_30650 [Planctomycetes bacterium Pla133]QDV02300.1 hypothetical protein Pla86_30640 [Planctomycetes bacterium Pla86]
MPAAARRGQAAPVASPRPRPAASVARAGCCRTHGSAGRRDLRRGHQSVGEQRLERRLVGIRQVRVSNLKGPRAVERRPGEAPRDGARHAVAIAAATGDLYRSTGGGGLRRGAASALSARRSVRRAAIGATGFRVARFDARAARGATIAGVRRVQMATQRREPSENDGEHDDPESSHTPIALPPGHVRSRLQPSRSATTSFSRCSSPTVASRRARRKSSSSRPWTIS